MANPALKLEEQFEEKRNDESGPVPKVIELPEQSAIRNDLLDIFDELSVPEDTDAPVPSKNYDLTNRPPAVSDLEAMLHVPKAPRIPRESGVQSLMDEDVEIEIPTGLTKNNEGRKAS